MPDTNPYQTCPTYETESFILRLVTETDADDLLQCYSDPTAVQFMNSDNCSSDFLFSTLAEMRRYIGFWLAEYQSGGYVRFAVVAKRSGRAVGTIEMFGREGAGDSGRFGVLRIDLRSDHEQRGYISELLRLACAEFYEAFSVGRIITKAIPTAGERLAALAACGFTGLAAGSLVPYDHYQIR